MSQRKISKLNIFCLFIKIEIHILKIEIVTIIVIIAINVCGHIIICIDKNIKYHILL